MSRKALNFPVICRQFRELQQTTLWDKLFSVEGARRASALAAEQQNISAPRTHVNSPTLHSDEHLGMWYNIEPDVANRLFGICGLPKKFVTNCKTFTETAVMVREPALTVMDYIKKSDLSMTPNNFFFYGKDGVGKTISLAHILHYLSENSWLLVHTGSAPNMRRKVQEVIPSNTIPGNFDHPTAASRWLQHFKSQNGELLDKLQLKTGETYAWSRREATEAGSPIMDLVEHGINRNRYSTDAVLALTKELKRNATEGSCKVAFAADGINSFFCPKTFYKVDNVYVGPARFTLSQAFTSFLKKDWKNGVVVGTIDRLANDIDRRESNLPRYVLRQKGWETVDPFVPVLVEDYTPKEMISILDYYTEREWIQSVDGTDEEARRELAAYSNHNPYTLMTICRSL